jgi:hypothetical protein
MLADSAMKQKVSYTREICYIGEMRNESLSDPTTD